MNKTQLFEALSLLRPFDIPSLPKRRMGANSDGGYVIFDELEAIGPVYTFGLGKLSCETEFAEVGKQVFLFDPHLDGPSSAHFNFNFQRQGLVGSEGARPGFHTLQHYIAELGHAAREDLFLRLDLEGAEWEVLPKIPMSILTQFRQLLIEIHWLSRLNEQLWHQVFCSAIRLLNRCFVLGHVHANNYAPLNIIGGFVCPDVLELTYIRSDIALRSESRTVFPTNLDFPNHPGTPDHLLWFYPFLPVGNQISATSFCNSLESSQPGDL